MKTKLTFDDIFTEVLAHHSPEQICAMTFKEWWHEHQIINGYEDNEIDKHVKKYLTVYLMIVKQNVLRLL
jgi:hypothetical protein